MLQIIAHRYGEVMSLLPLLHLKPGPAVVAVLGPHAAAMAAEALRWRDTTVLSLVPLALHPSQSSRVTVVEKLDPACCDVLLTSPEQSIEPWVKALRPNGVAQMTTFDQDKAKRITTLMRGTLGTACPWREHLPQPIYGVLGVLGKSCKRLREPPPAARRLTTQYLPCLFTFGKDELPLVFSPNPGKIQSPQPTPAS